MRDPIGSFFSSHRLFTTYCGAVGVESTFGRFSFDTEKIVRIIAFGLPLLILRESARSFLV